MGDTGNRDIAGRQSLRDVMSRSLAFHRWIGGDDHFLESSLLDSRQQLRNANSLWAEAVQGGKGVP